MDGQKIPPFYRTLTPTGAAALLLQRKLKPNILESIVRKGKGTADHLMPLGNWFRAAMGPQCSKMGDSPFLDQDKVG